MDFAQELIDDVLENYPLQGMTCNPVLDDLLKQEKELIENEENNESQNYKNSDQELKKSKRWLIHGFRYNQKRF